MAHYSTIARRSNRAALGGARCIGTVTALTVKSITYIPRRMEQQLRGPSLKWRMLVDGSNAKDSLSGGGVGLEQGLQVYSTSDQKVSSTFDQKERPETRFA